MAGRILIAWLVLSIPVALLLSAVIAHGGPEPADTPGGATAPAAGDGSRAECAAGGTTSPAATGHGAAVAGRRGGGG